jgi:hypothetical protein
VTGEPTRDPAGVDELLADLAEEGHRASVAALEGGQLRCGACGQVSEAGEFAVAALRRTEGVSDPGDMSAVVALTCPRCGTKGTAVLRFGPEADATDADVLAALDRPSGRS